MSIQVLDQNTINQIAAGEVIERPASIVKELMENAIDAKATAITVEIKEGGISFIRITDNGCGIAKKEIPTAFLRHSTSKIKVAEDLLTVSSLGFRGEALSSIAAVSQVELITKTADSLTGCRYVIEGGTEHSIEEVGAPDGTTFLVRNLFFNTPARRKFLKTPSTEAGYISDIVERIALSHPDISIRFIHNNQNKLHTAGNDNLKDILYHVYGRDVAKNLLEVHWEGDYLQIHGFIGKPIVSRGNRNFENYFINGRFIKNNIISRGIEEAYKPYMMQHRYPFTALHFSIDSQLIDVNVHPTKMELRLQNGEEIFHIIHKVISDALAHKEYIPRMEDKELPSKAVVSKFKESQSEAFKSKEEKSTQTFAVVSREASISKTIPAAAPEKKEPVRSPESFEYRRIQEEQTGKTYIAEQEKPYQVSKQAETVVSPRALEQVPESKELQGKQQSLEEYGIHDRLEEENTNLLDIKNVKSHKIIGQLFATYWLVEFDDKLFIIDQHAAHEKVLYEKFMNRVKSSQTVSQNLLPPIVITLGMAEEQALKTHMDVFFEMGFEVEHFGGKEYTISAVPMELYQMNPKQLFMDVLDELVSFGTKSTDAIKDRIATMACKAAVKGHDLLSVAEAKGLIDELLLLENPYHCPHGRPTIIQMSKYEIEKKFKRIV